jgi:predicted nicotinamide N-methyase
VLAIDADPAVFPFLTLHAQHNGVDIETRQQYFDSITVEQLASIDLLIAADICFWDELAQSVAALVDRACEAGVSRIVIADPERPPFFDMASGAMQRHCGELFQWRVAQPQRASGCILLIENA